MQRNISFVVGVLLMLLVSACAYNGPVLTPNFLVDEPRGPMHSEVHCTGCTLELTQECLKESARNIGFEPHVSATTFDAISFRHITPRKLHGTFEEVDGGVIVRADIDANMPSTKNQLGYEFVGGMNKCNTRRVPKEP